MANFLTQAELTQQYINNIIALNPNVNPQIISTDWWVKSNIQGGALAGLYQNAYNLRQAIFIQNAYGNTLDYYLASNQLTPRLGASPATGYAALTIAPSAVTIIPAGTQLTLGSNVYLVTQTVTVDAMTYTAIPISIASQAIGQGTALINGTQLIFATPISGIATFVVVSSMNDGANAESDASVQYRLLQAKQTPKTGGSLTDYINWCISQPDITNVFTQNANILGLNVLALFLMSGSGDIDNIVANIPPGSYNRTTTAIDIVNCQNYVLSVKPLFDQLLFNTVYTYVINGALNFNITNLTFVPNVDLTSVLPGYTVTVQTLIAQQLRRGILSTPLGGTVNAGLQYIIMNTLTTAIYNGLNSINGVYAQIIVSFQLNFNGLFNDIQVPTTLVGGAYPAVYDINFTNITYTLS